MRFVPRFAVRSVLLLLFAAAIGASTALADSPANGQLLVPGDHHLPGESIEITGYQLDPGVDVAFTLVSGATTVDLASAVVGSDGTLSTTAVVPPTFPTGYANVVGTAVGGARWTYVVLIGERAEGPGASNAPAPVISDGPVDDQVIGLLMAAFGVVLVLVAAAWWWTGRRRKDAPAA